MSSINLIRTPSEFHYLQDDKDIFIKLADHVKFSKHEFLQQVNRWYYAKIRFPFSFYFNRNFSSFDQSVISYYGSYQVMKLTNGNYTFAKSENFVEFPTRAEADRRARQYLIQNTALPFFLKEYSQETLNSFLDFLHSELGLKVTYQLQQFADVNKVLEVYYSFQGSDDCYQASFNAISKPHCWAAFFELLADNATAPGYPESVVQFAFDNIRKRLLGSIM